MRLLLCLLLLSGWLPLPEPQAPSPATGIRLPALFSDNMVVQRDTSIAVWGRADAGGTLRISLDTASAEATADAEGRWQATLPPLPAGGPHEMVIAGADTITLENVLIGEVWVASGQSNMWWPVSLSADAEREIAAASHPGLRLFTVEQAVSAAPKEDVESDGWQVCSPETVARFSAVAYYFGRLLHQELGVPVGLIHTSWGGTPAEAWTSGPALKQLPDFQAAVEHLEAADPDQVIAQEEEAYATRLAAWSEEVRRQDAGYLATGTTWADPAFDASRWPTMQLPGLWEEAGLPGFDGVVWFRKEIDLPSGRAEQDLLLHLGPIGDIDSTWVNGTLVGSMSQYNEARTYRVPAALLQPGRNVIVVRVLDTGGGGGFAGAPEALRLEAAGDTASALALAGPWHYRETLDLASLPETPAPPRPQNQPTMLYNAMIAPLVPYTMRGVIWYQGESNAARAYQYRTLFPALIQDWRSQWNQGDFPFLFVQLANFMDPQTDPNEESAWAELREAQRATLQLPNTAMAVTIDIGEADDIHPRNKQDVGRRLALAALNQVYGRDVVYSGPTYQGMRREGNAIRLLFSHAGGGLVARGGPLRGFTIAGRDGQFVWAEARIEGNTILVSSPQVRDPVAVRYGWANNPDVNLYNREGLPASPFRTDDWEGITERNE